MLIVHLFAPPAECFVTTSAWARVGCPPPHLEGEGAPKTTKEEKGPAHPSVSPVGKEGAHEAIKRQEMIVGWSLDARGVPPSVLDPPPRPRRPPTKDSEIDPPK